MEPSLKKRKRKIRISVIAMAVIALTALVFFVLIPENNSNSGNVDIPKKDTVSAKTTVTKEPAVSEDSIIREMEREKEREKEGYEKEKERFAKVLEQASDEELFTVLNYAIAQHYVPNRHVDPYGYMFVGVTSLHRSYLIYEKLLDRKDLLRKIYPDVKVLHEYVYWGRQTGKPYPDKIVSKTILNNAQKGSRKMDSELVSKYFGTPLFHD
jgi:hypothetical protein